MRRALTAFVHHRVAEGPVAAHCDLVSSFMNSIDYRTEEIHIELHYNQHPLQCMQSLMEISWMNTLAEFQVSPILSARSSRYTTDQVLLGRYMARFRNAQPPTVYG
jgi:hypothetical protein